MLALGNIVERSNDVLTPPAAPIPPGPSTAGFPSITHRSLKPKRPSAFAVAATAARQKSVDVNSRSSSNTTSGRAVISGRAIEATAIPSLSTADVGASRSRQDIASISVRGDAASNPSSSSGPHIIKTKDEYSRIQREIGNENRKRVEGMTEAERRFEIEELEERFGASVLQALRKRAEKRAEKANENGKEGPRHAESREAAIPDPDRDERDSDLLSEVAIAKSNASGPSSLDSSATAATATAPTRRKSVRFDTVPPSGPADLKSTYFADVPTESDKLAWMSDPLPSSAPISTVATPNPSLSSIRFDLSGNLLSPTQQSDLPTHLGLHHHGDQPDMAGYTISEILWLCRSTVPAQRIGMMGLLSRIVGRYVLEDTTDCENVRAVCGEEGVMAKAVALAVDVLQTSRNVTLLQTAIELLYTVLGGPTWHLLSQGVNGGGLEFRPEPDAHGRAANIASVPFEDLLPRLSDLFNTASYLPQGSIEHLIAILRRACIYGRATAETILALIPSIVQTHVIRRPWPPLSDTDDIPLLSAIQLMGDVIASSRSCSMELVDAGLPGSLLRFCVVSTWSQDPESDSNSDLGIQMCIETLRIHASLARYGLSSGLARTAHDVWAALGAHVKELLKDPSNATMQLVTAYFRLIEGWITCAIDPHRTTPEHDLTWTQIAGLGWADEAMEAVDRLVENDERREGQEVGVLAAAMSVLAAWVKGASVNEVKGGEKEKERLRSWIVDRRLSKFAGEEMADPSASDTRENTDSLILACLRLQASLQSPGIESAQQSSSDTFLVTYDSAEIAKRSSGSKFLSRGIQFQSIHHEILHSHHGSGNKRDISLKAFDLLTSFQPGEEPLALNLLDLLLKLHWRDTVPSLCAILEGIGHPDSLTLLRPLLQHAILPDVSDITAPSIPHHLYLKATGTLRSSPARMPDETGRLPPGLPLRSNWFFHPIDELLHSADSAALQQAPPDWDPSELQIVRATMVFLRLAVACGVEMGRSELLFGLMKVYMLEHQTGAMIVTGESEIFRDEVVLECLVALIGGMTSETTEIPSPEGTLAPKASEIASVQRSGAPMEAGLELAAKPFLGLEPFFQFYSDLVSLFENVSFGDKTFAQIIITPLSMAYSADYRKLAWSNPNVLRLLRLRAEDIPLEVEDAEVGIRSFFSQAETDPEVLSNYGQAVVRRWVRKEAQPFLWDVAIHHLREFFAPAICIGEEKGSDRNEVDDAAASTGSETETQVALSRLRSGMMDAIRRSGNQVVLRAVGLYTHN